MMLTIIVLLFPGIIAAKYYFKLQNKKEDRLSFIVDISIFTFLINMFNVGVLFLNGNEYLNLMADAGSNLNYTKFLLKYMLLSFMFSLLLPHIKVFIDSIDMSGVNDSLIKGLGKLRKRNNKNGQVGEGNNDKDKGK